MGEQILSKQNSLSSSCWDTPSFAQPYPLLLLFCEAVLVSDDGESQGFGRLLWSCSSLSHNREQMGFFLWASLASSLTKLSLTFTLAPLYSCVCFTVAQQRCPEIRVTELVFLPRHMELCLHVVNKLQNLLSFISLYKHEPFLSQKRGKTKQNKTILRCFFSIFHWQEAVTWGGSVVPVLL